MNELLDITPLDGFYSVGDYEIFADPDKFTYHDLLSLIEDNDLKTPKELADYARANHHNIQVYEIKSIRI